MTPLLLLLLGLCLIVLTAAMCALGISIAIASVWCALRGRHEPARHPLGGFRCSRCGKAGATLDDLGFDGIDYVTPPAVREHEARAHDGAGRGEARR